MNADEIVPEQLRILLAQKAADEQEELERVWRLAAGSRRSLPADQLDFAVHQFEARLRRSPDRSPVLRKPGLTYQWGIAATIGCFLLFGIWYLSSPVERKVPIGTTMLVSLPDGSAITLNGGAKVEYRRQFWGSTRPVHLSGEAYFEVEPAEAPFVVSTSNAVVHVLGTSFNVQAWDASRTAVTVKTGEVRLSASTLEGVVLNAGQMSQVLGRSTPPTKPIAVNTGLTSLWMQGGFASIDRPLAELIKGLGHRFGTNIIIHDEVLANDTLTWIQPNISTLDLALAEICEIVGCSPEQHANGYRVVRSQ